MTTYLVGDSHLARIQRDLPQIGPDVVNLAIGGSVVTDVPPQLRGVAADAGDVLVLSVGTNDAVPGPGVPLGEFGEALAALVAAHPLPRWVYVAPAGCVESRVPPGRLRDADLARYAERGADVLAAAGGKVVDTRAMLADLGTSAFTEDGFHLSGAAYHRLVPALAALT